MHQECRNSKGTDRQSCFFVFRFPVVIDIPIDAGVYIHIDFCIVQSGDTGQNHRRTVGLDGVAVIKIFDILQKYTHRNLFISIIACQVNANHRYEFDFRMAFQNVEDFLFFAFGCRDQIK